MVQAKGAPLRHPFDVRTHHKKDAMFNPLCAKLRIVALGNHKDHIRTKSEKYAPVHPPNSMQLITSLDIEKCRTLKQSDCKNAFCPGILPDDEITIIKPPIDDPNIKNKY